MPILIWGGLALVGGAIWGGARVVDSAADATGDSIRQVLPLALVLGAAYLIYQGKGR